MGHQLSRYGSGRNAHMVVMVVLRHRVLGIALVLGRAILPVVRRMIAIVMMMVVFVHMMPGLGVMPFFVGMRVAMKMKSRHGAGREPGENAEHHQP